MIWNGSTIDVPSHLPLFVQDTFVGFIQGEVRFFPLAGMNHVLSTLESHAVTSCIFCFASETILFQLSKVLEKMTR